MSAWRSIPYTGQNCEHIPGLYVSKDGRALQGPYDAFAALAQRKEITEEVLRSLIPARLPPTKTPSLLDTGPLRPYQVEGVRRVVSALKTDQGHILADDMGLGKTLQSCSTWDALGRPFPLLVAAPAAVRRTWAKEFKKWLGLKPRLVETGAQAAKVMRDDLVVITSYDLIGRGALPLSFVPHATILDEAHLLRGRQAKRNERLHAICQTATYRLALTGTPMWGRPRDLWQVLKYLFHYRFGNADQFDYAYCAAFINKWGGKENKGIARSDELRARLSYVMTRRTKAELGSQLPSLTRSVRWLPPTKPATKMLQAYAGKQCSLTDALVATLEEKIKPAADLVEELEGNAVVFTWRKQDVAALAAEITKRGVDCVTITGDQSHAAREVAVRQATERKACVVATIDSTGTGVDGLQHVADTVIFHALDYTPTKMAQAESRLHRLGQSEPVTAIFLAMENSADRFVVEKVVDKLESWRQTMGTDSTTKMQESMAAPAEIDEKYAAEIYAAVCAAYNEDEE